MRTVLRLGPLCLALMVLVTGCYTELALNIRNGTSGKVLVKSAYTGQDISIERGRAKRLPHSSGDILVTTKTAGSFRFHDVSLLAHDIPDRFLQKGSSIFGPGYLTLNVLLATNMDIYVLMPGQKTSAAPGEQPRGYPIRGERAVPLTPLPALQDNTKTGKGPP
jgi:hypothetical protein